jgi:cbb3-type cytochrome oxidase maturation protein
MMKVISLAKIGFYICLKEFDNCVMSVMVVLLGASLLVGLVFLIAFIWSVKSGQMDDDYTPAHKVLFDNYSSPSTKPNKSTAKTKC